MGDWTNLIIFTDGSHQQQPDDHKHVSGAAWAVYRAWDIVAEGRRSQGNSTSFDAEMMALAMAFKAVLKYMEELPDGSDDISNIHLYIDNKAAVNKILNPRIHLDQDCSI